MRQVLRCCGLACAVALLSVSPAGAADRDRSVGAEEVARLLSAGRTVVRSQVVVHGPLDLRALTVPGAFKCRQCVFEGPFLAADATFERTLDVSGSRFTNRVDLSGATFRGPALFRSLPQLELAFERRADFSLAVFESTASFGEARFADVALFQDARFGEALFTLTTFLGRAVFDRASFQSSASFTGARFFGDAAFTGATFRDRADFGVSLFVNGASFASTQFGRQVSFLASEFRAPNRKGQEDEREALELSGGMFSGNLDLTFTTLTFEPAPQPAASERRNGGRQIADFDKVVCGGSLIMKGISFKDDPRFDARVSMAQVQAGGLVLDVDEVRRIGADDQQDVLRAIEESAKARGDLGVANDAHFERLKLRSAGYGPITRAFDFVFYRNIAGYFVRPFRPLIVLALIATIVAAVRFGRQRTSRPSETNGESDTSDSGRAVRAQSADFLTCLLDTFALAGPRWGSRQVPLTLGERFEVILFRVLLVCALVGLASSNPTLRNMVDTLL